MSIVEIVERKEQKVPEGGTARIKFQVQDYDDVDIVKANISAAVMILYDVDSSGIINSHSGTNVLSDISTAGLMTRILTVDDNPIVNSDGTPEEHIVRFTITGTSGDGKVITIPKEISFHVVDFASPS